MSDISRPINLEPFEAGLRAFIAVNGDVQIGWCRKTGQRWFVEDMDLKRLAGPFKRLDLAKKAGRKVLASKAGESNPGW